VKKRFNLDRNHPTFIHITTYFIHPLLKMAFTTNATIASFGGKLLKLSHEAKTTACTMNLNMFLPPQASSKKVPVLFFLSGLTCTGDNCAEKGFFQHKAAEKGIAVVYPDTSPRTLLLPQHPISSSSSFIPFCA
jgi:S-formylglutathione hydrolase FrmB